MKEKKDVLKKKPSEPKFFSYFDKNKKEALYNHCRPHLIGETGIADEMFDNNCPESMNAALKRWNDHGKEDIFRVVQDIKDFIAKQQHDVSKAFTGMSGPYEVKPEYKDHLSKEYWSLEFSERQAELDRVSTIPLQVSNENEPSLDKMDKLKENFTNNHVEAMKTKVKRIINGNIRQGFSGPKSRLVPSESGTQPYAITCPARFNYMCSNSCIQFKSQKICSHTLAAATDNGELSEFLDIFLSKGTQTNLTTLATANVSRNSGKKPGQTSRKRKSGRDASSSNVRQTLKEALANDKSDTSLLLYSAQQSGDNSMRLKLTRVGKEKPQKPQYKPTENTPFELIPIKGNIRVCAGCREELKDGLDEMHVLDSVYCIRHKENDYFFLETKNQWLKKFENKHYHISKDCLIERNPHFDPDNLTLCLEHTITDTF